MKKQKSKSKVKETPKRQYNKKKEEPQKEQQAKKQSSQKQAETEEEQDEHYEDDKIMESKTENKTSKNVDIQNSSDEKPEPFIEPQSKVPDNPITQLNQSQIQALRSRFSGLTPDHFEGETAEQVLEHLAEVTNTDINELKIIAKSWEQPPQNPII